MVSISESILTGAARNFGVVVGTLDAIHFETSLLFRNRNSFDYQMLTHDKALAIAARLAGLAVQGLVL